MEQTEPTILLVEDSEDDVFIMKHTLNRAGVVYPLHVVSDGQMALDYLAGRGTYSNRQLYPVPFIVFLDLKLPYIHGFEVLEWIGQQEALKTLMVVVLTSSDEQRDQQRAYSLGARSYMVKPPRLNSLRKIFESFAGSWPLRSARPPLAGGPRTST